MSTSAKALAFDSDGDSTVCGEVLLAAVVRQIRAHDLPSFVRFRAEWETFRFGSGNTLESTPDQASYAVGQADPCHALDFDCCVSKARLSGQGLPPVGCAQLQAMPLATMAGGHSSIAALT